MGKAAKQNRERRMLDTHEPKPSDLVAGTLDPKTKQASIPRRANWWHELPGRRVGCTLCYRNCEIAPGEAGWCRIRRNDGGTLRLTDHAVIANCQPEVIHFSGWRNHARSVWVSGVGCTAGCTFCTSTRIAWSPERLPWAYGGERRVGQDGGWAYHRAMLHPEAVVGLAEKWACSGVYFGANESTLTYEWTIDAARSARAAGLWTHMDTNGFTSVPAIRALSPFLSMVYLGVKGSADPQFYEKRMRSPGAVPQVLAAAKAWHDSPTHLGISDVIQPFHWADDATVTEHMKRLYSWIAEELSPLVPLELRPMIKPELVYGEWNQPLLPRDATLVDEMTYMDRLHLAEAVAAECGLRYIYTDERREVRCHRCGDVLVGKLGWTNFDLNVGTDGRCGSCGGQTPIVGIGKDEYDAIQHEELARAAA